MKWTLYFPTSLAGFILTVRSKFSQHYFDSFSSSSDPNEVTHGVTVIGYGKTDSNVQYWIIKNSFGENWGEDGYIRIAMKDNVCGVKNYLHSIGFKTPSMVESCFSS